MHWEAYCGYVEPHHFLREHWLTELSLGLWWAGSRSLRVRLGKKKKKCIIIGIYILGWKDEALNPEQVSLCLSLGLQVSLSLSGQGRRHGPLYFCTSEAFIFSISNTLVQLFVLLTPSLYQMPPDTQGHF